MTCLSKQTFSPQLFSGSLPAPTFVYQTYIELTYPYVSPTVSLTMRNPNVGDGHSCSLFTAKATLRGGENIYFRDPDWPVTRVLSLGFSAIDNDKLEELYDFLDESIGKEVGLLDWLGRQWRGIIITSNGLGQYGKECDNVVGFDFRGTLV